MAEKIYKNTSSRLAAIQILYSLGCFEDVREDKIESIIAKYNEDYVSENYGVDEEKPSKAFLLRLVQSILLSCESLDEKIKQHLNRENSFERLSLIMISLLRCALAEAKYFDTPKKIIIKEYMKVADRFFSGAEVGFINGMLDKLV